MQVAAIAQVVLEGIPLPVRKEIVVEYAQRQNAPTAVLEALRKIPNRQYLRIDDIGEAIQSVQPAFSPPDVHVPQVESGDVPGGEAYLDASQEPGWIRDKPGILDYEQQLVREPSEEIGGGIPESGDEDEAPGDLPRGEQESPLKGTPRVGRKRKDEQ